MGKIVVGEFITLDGVIRGPGGADEDIEGGCVHHVDGCLGLAELDADLRQRDRLHTSARPSPSGSGKRIRPFGPRRDLELIEATPMPTGVVFMRYRRAR